jgi:2-C-methyl-D-erythritol 4-phosphate cytidylyltransferase
VLHSSQESDVPTLPYADAVVLAAGTSERMNGVDKLMMSIAGLPLVAWTLRSVAAATCVRKIIVVARPDRVEELANTPDVRALDAIVVPGGPRRQDSVANGVEAATAPVVLIHDGARPLVTPGLVDRVAAEAWRMGAAVPVVAVPESMREVVDGEIVRTVDRTRLYRSQTPHGARLELLRRAYSIQDPRGPETFIDETTLVQSAGISVATVPGEPQNLKVTLPGDDELAIALLGARALSSDLLRVRIDQ